MTLETVCVETPAALATSLMVARLLVFIISSNYGKILLSFPLSFTAYISKVH
jgi:hypothetical protein